VGEERAHAGGGSRGKRKGGKLRFSKRTQNRKGGNGRLPPEENGWTEKSTKVPLREREIKTKARARERQEKKNITLADKKVDFG